MFINIQYKTKGPYKTVQETLDQCGSLELPTGQLYKNQENISIEITQCVRVIINEHFGPVLWLYPNKDWPNYDPDVVVEIIVNDLPHLFPTNFPDCYGLDGKSVIEVNICRDNVTTSHKITFTATN